MLLHTPSHLLIQSLAMRCGYPASSIPERIYADSLAEHYGILLYTGSPDAEGTLGSIVQQARHIEEHLARALAAMSALCSNDLVCAQHAPGGSLECRWLHRAACHGLRPGLGNLLRVAQRLPGPGARRPGPRRARRGLLQGHPVIDALLDRPAHLRKRLVSALESGMLTGAASAASLGSILGVREGGEDVLADLLELERLGISGAAAAAWIRTVEQAAARTPRPDLVWSGPEVPGLHARDTRRVYEELLGSAVSIFIT